MAMALRWQRVWVGMADSDLIRAGRELMAAARRARARGRPAEAKLAELALRRECAKLDRISDQAAKALRSGSPSRIERAQTLLVASRLDCELFFRRLAKELDT